MVDLNARVRSRSVDVGGALANDFDLFAHLEHRHRDADRQRLVLRNANAGPLDDGLAQIKPDYVVIARRQLGHDVATVGPRNLDLLRLQRRSRDHDRDARQRLVIRVAGHHALYLAILQLRVTDARPAHKPQ